MQPLEDRRLLSVSAEEQFFIYRLNRARHNPQAYASEANLGINLSGHPARQPLAINTSLLNSSGFKSNEMATNNYFAHQSAVTNIWPNKLVRNHGYAIPSQWADNNNFVESLAAGHVYPDAVSAMDALIIDAGVAGAGHRAHLLSTTSDSNREIGIGFASNSNARYANYWSIHLAYSNVDDRFLTGVAFDDKNGNGRYDLNEGRSGISISAGAGLKATTNSYGGWSIKVTPGDYTVTASGGSHGAASSVPVTVDDSNVEVDFVSGLATGYVDFSLVTLTPGVTVVESSGSTSVSEGGSTDQFSVALKSPPTGNVVLDIASDDIGEATVNTDSLTFTPTNWSTAQIVTVEGADDSIVDGDQTTSIRISVNDNASASAYRSVADQNVLVTTSDDDVYSGNVDGDSDFDANDSFLIHLVRLSGSDSLIESSKGTSSLSATDIRNNINQLQVPGDVDGNQTFDANDSFLIHLVKLAGSDDLIDQSKGSSPLSAAQIRANIAGIDLTSRSSRTASRKTATAANNLTATTMPGTKLGTSLGAEESRELHLPSDEAKVITTTVNVFDDFRDWIDAI